MIPYDSILLRIYNTQKETNKTISEIMKDVNDIEDLTDMSIHQLLKLLAAGWTLQPQKTPCKLSDLIRYFE